MAKNKMCNTTAMLPIACELPPVVDIASDVSDDIVFQTYKRRSYVPSNEINTTPFRASFVYCPNSPRLQAKSLLPATNVEDSMPELQLSDDGCSSYEGSLSELSSSSSSSSSRGNEDQTHKKEEPSRRRVIFKQYWKSRDCNKATVDGSCLTNGILRSPYRQYYGRSSKDACPRPKLKGFQFRVRFSKSVESFDSTETNLPPAHQQWWTQEEVRRFQFEFAYHLSRCNRGYKALLNGKGLLSEEVTRALKKCYEDAD
mmetsp:Transcript_5423/g.7321  ORF Transcript_5423/g.7321 Transcript_5423/m.7321 type:complete len:257 (-) Transcript_5423:133-903(-)